MNWILISQGFYTASANGWELKKILVSHSPVKYKYVAEKGTERITGSYNLISKVVNNTTQTTLF